LLQAAGKEFEASFDACGIGLAIEKRANHRTNPRQSILTGKGGRLLLETILGPQSFAGCFETDKANDGLRGSKDEPEHIHSCLPTPASLHPLLLDGRRFEESRQRNPGSGALEFQQP